MRLGQGFCTVKTRETVGWTRELLGANASPSTTTRGASVADAEAIDSYEGTREINALNVGRSITGLSAFV